MPSMSEAWLSSSEMIASSAPKSVSKTPPLASKQDENKIVSSVPRNADRSASSAACSSWVPQMNRTLAIPKPHRSSASLAAATTRGSSARPR